MVIISTTLQNIYYAMLWIFGLQFDKIIRSKIITYRKGVSNHNGIKHPNHCSSKHYKGKPIKRWRRKAKGAKALCYASQLQYNIMIPNPFSKRKSGYFILY